MVETSIQQSEFFGPGISVEVGKIQRELKKLWQQNDQTASLLLYKQEITNVSHEHSRRTAS